MRLEGKAAMISGGASGMGGAIATLFGSEGADIALGDIDLERTNANAAKVRELGREAFGYKVDITNEEQVRGFLQETIERFGKVDILVNTVGIAEYVKAEEISSEKWRRMIDVNLTGMFYCCRDVGKEMIKRRQGKIINISSSAGLAGVPYMSHYVASKHAVVGLTKALAVEWGKYNINVNCICPGATMTPMLMNATTPKYREERIQRVPLHRLAEPDDQAKAALFLASCESDYLTGIVVCTDGGLSALAPSTSEGALKGET